MDETVDNVYRVLRHARRTKGWSQSALAERVGCAQSAISMMEGGKGDALSRDKLRAIAEELGVDDALPENGASAPRPAGARTYCPTPTCPTNLPYVVEDQLLFLPWAGAGARTGQPHCPMCGELLETRCPNPDCRAPVTQGACCRACGSAYVTAPPAPQPDLQDWAAARRDLISHLQMER